MCPKTTEESIYRQTHNVSLMDQYPLQDTSEADHVASVCGVSPPASSQEDHEDQVAPWDHQPPPDWDHFEEEWSVLWLHAGWEFHPCDEDDAVECQSMRVSPLPSTLTDCGGFL